MSNPNVLSDRYATDSINEIFSPEGIVRELRDLWILVMKIQRELGVDIPLGDIQKFDAAVKKVDLRRIREIELRGSHDVKANIEAFIEAAGAREYIHQAMTSRDVTDNVEQIGIRNASRIVFGKYVSVLRHLIEKAQEYRNVETVARTHNQPAQPTLLGRRFTMWAEELLLGLESFERVIANYPLRGIKGPVGTQSDMLALLDGDRTKVAELEKRIAAHYGFKRILDSPGQIYPRSLDFEIGAELARLGAPLSSFSATMRLMAGYELVTEGFKEGRVGSSAMPYKMNTSRCERITALMKELRTCTTGLLGNMGDQWFEGDVSDSLPRRTNIPDIFYASDGMAETSLTVLDEMGIYPTMVTAEVARYINFLTITRLLKVASDAGLGREEAHEIIKEHSIAEALAMREKAKSPEIILRLAMDPRFQIHGITREMMEASLEDRTSFLGNAEPQLDAVMLRAQYFFGNYPTQATYEPQPIL